MLLLLSSARVKCHEVPTALGSATPRWVLWPYKHKTEGLCNPAAIVLRTGVTASPGYRYALISMHTRLQRVDVESALGYGGARLHANSKYSMESILPGLSSGDGLV